MEFNSFADLPATHRCRVCKHKKPIAQMVVVRLRRTGKILLRARCKSCNNERERGHRRDWKTKYLRRWRKCNAQLDESYWRKYNRENRKQINARAERRRKKLGAVLLIQGRIYRRLGITVPLTEAKRMLATYGPMYPLRCGLTPRGLRECERIRARLRHANLPVNVAEIRMIVYDEPGFRKKPQCQKPTRQMLVAAERLRQWHAKRRTANETTTRTIDRTSSGSSASKSFGHASPARDEDAVHGGLPVLAVQARQRRVRSAAQPEPQTLRPE